MPGIFAGLLVVILSVSFALLIFSGPLASHLSAGIAMAIVTALVTGLVWTLFGQVRPMVAMVDEDTAPVIALLAMFVVSAIPADAQSAQLPATVLAAIVISTLLAGGGLAVIGMLRLGTSMQYLPHSVMGGYFAAIGWLLVAGGFGATAPGTGGGYPAISDLMDPTGAWSWLPALAVTGSLMLLKARVSRTLLVPGVVLVACALWFGLALARGYGPGELSDAGLLIGPFAETRLDLFNPLAGLTGDGANWSAALSKPGSILTVLLMSVLSLMFCIHGLGLLHRVDPDMNHELKLAGAANLLCGLSGGMPGLPSYGMSSLSRELGADRSVWPGVLTIAVVLAVATVGLDLVALAPRFVLGGLLMYLGVQLLHEWLLEARHRFSLPEYAIIPGILLVSVGVGFLQGVLVGLIAAVILFVVKYSRTRVIRFRASGSEINSNVDRNLVAGELLETHGEQTLAFGLQGFLFFGTAGRVYEALKQELGRRRASPLRYFIIDFARVSGVDASAALNFRKIELLAARTPFQLVLAGVEDRLLERLRRGGFGTEGAAGLRVFPDLDRALEWTENRILAEVATESLRKSCFEQMLPFLGSEERLEVLRQYLEERQVRAGEVLAREGAESTELFFIETVAASAYIHRSDGSQIRVRTTEQGTVYGELGFYLSTRRTATIQTENDGTIYVLSQAQLKRLEKEHPQIAAGLHRFMARLLSERLLNTTQTLKALSL